MMEGAEPTGSTGSGGPDEESGGVVLRLSGSLGVLLVGILMVLGVCAWQYSEALSTSFLVLAALLGVLWVRLRRICRAELSSTVLKCYGLTGGLFLDLHRESVFASGCELDGDEYREVIRSRDGQVPMPIYYDDPLLLRRTLREWDRQNHGATE